MKDLDMTRTLDQILTDAQDALIVAKANLSKHIEFLKEASSAAQSKNDAKLIGKAKQKATRLASKLEGYHNDALDAVDELDTPLGDNMAARR